MTSLAAGNATSVEDVLLPGFLDSLTKGEKGLVIFAISFMIVFIPIAIGGLVCMLSGSGKKLNKKEMQKLTDPTDISGSYHNMNTQKRYDMYYNIPSSYVTSPTLLTSPDRDSYGAVSENRRLTRFKLFKSHHHEPKRSSSKSSSLPSTRKQAKMRRSEPIYSVYGQGRRDQGFYPVNLVTVGDTADPPYFR